MRRSASTAPTYGTATGRCKAPVWSREVHMQLSTWSPGRRLAPLMVLSVMVSALVLGPPASSAAPPRPSQAAEGSPRYELAGGCYLLRPSTAARPASKAGGGYGVTASGAPEPLRLQATDLGSYLLYDAGRQFLTAGQTAPSS